MVWVKLLPLQIVSLSDVLGEYIWNSGAISNPEELGCQEKGTKNGLGLRLGGCACHCGSSGSYPSTAPEIRDNRLINV
jgi:hypothetical protein